jgi:hypothetical protein
MLARNFLLRDLRVVLLPSLLSAMPHDRWLVCAVFAVFIVERSMTLRH